MHARALDYAMHNYAQLCTIMHDSAQLCGTHFNEDTRGLQIRGILGLQSPKYRQYRQYSKVASSHSYAVRSEASLHITIAHQHFGTIISANPLSFGSRRDTTFFLNFRRWKNFIVLQSIFSSGNMRRCILVEEIVHDKHNNELHWTRAKQNIMHNYAR